METQVVHNEAESRYELRAGDAEIGIAEYRVVETARGPIADFHHTVIAPAHRGQGYAERLVRAALDDVRSRQLRVRPSCWYVDQFIVEHPEYAELRV